jgi:hypothetical protein
VFTLLAEELQVYCCTGIVSPTNESFIMMFSIVGTGRCGTHLIQEILNSHPSIYVNPGTNWIRVMHEFYGMTSNPLVAYIDVMERTYEIDGSTTLDYMLEWAGMSRTAFYEALKNKLVNALSLTASHFTQTVLECLTSFNGKSIYGDKSSGCYMSLLQTLWPRCRFIHIIRDGRDVALSMSLHPGFRRMVSLRASDWESVSFNKYYNTGHTGPGKCLLFGKEILRRMSDDDPLVDYIRFWERSIRRISDESSRLQKNTYIEVRYEDLLDEPTTNIARILKFLEVKTFEDWIDSATLRIHRGKTDKVRSALLFKKMTLTSKDTLNRYGYA